MKKLVFKIIIGIVSLFGADIFGQSNDHITTPIEKSLKVDLTGLAFQSFTLDYEQPIGKRMSYNVSSGLKFYSDSPDLEVGTIVNSYTQIDTRTYTRLLFSGSTTKDTHFEGSPLNDLEAFVPTYSIPIQNSFRYYLNPMNKGKFYLETGLLTSINKVYNIEDEESRSKATINEDDYSPTSLLGALLFDSNTEVTTHQVRERRTVTEKFNLSAGMSGSFGFNAYLGKNYLLDIKGELGFNFANSLASHSYTYSPLGASYAKLKMLIGFRL